MKAGDNVAISRTIIPKGTVIKDTEAALKFTVSSHVLEGHRFAIRFIRKGASLLSWGLPFGALQRAVTLCVVESSFVSVIDTCIHRSIACQNWSFFARIYDLSFSLALSVHPHVHNTLHLRLSHFMFHTYHTRVNRYSSS